MVENRQSIDDKNPVKTDTAFQNIVENNELNIDENEMKYDRFSNYNDVKATFCIR